VEAGEGGLVEGVSDAGSSGIGPKMRSVSLSGLREPSKTEKKGVFFLKKVGRL
jgi:hypothetical protein